MPQGIEIYNEYGSIQASDSMVSLGLVTANEVTLTSSNLSLPQPLIIAEVTVTGTNPIIAFKPNLNKFVTVDRVAISGSTFTFYLIAQSSTPVNVSYWIFDTVSNAAKDPTLSNCGAQAFDEFGVLTWDASYSALRVVGAVSPGGGWTDVNVPAGKMYAIIQSLGKYTSETYDLGAYSNADTPPDNWDINEPMDPVPLGTKWRLQHTNVYRGAAGYTSDTNLRVGMASYESWSQWNEVSSIPRTDTFGQLSYVIVDVTGFIGSNPSTPSNLSATVNTTTIEVSGPAGTTLISPAVTVTASGGTSPYTVLWQYVSGSTSPTNYDATSSTSFRLQSTNHPASTVRSTVWRAKITDSQGTVAYSPDVTFTFTAAGDDYVPTAITPFDLLQVQSNDHDVAWSSGVRQITGINQPIILRFERYNYTGNLSALHVDVYTSTTSASGPWTHHGYYNAHDAGLQYIDATVTNNTWVMYTPHAITSSGMRSATVDFALWNLSNPGGPVTLTSTNGNTFKVDADGNYNVVDVTPDPMSWSHQSWVTDSESVTGAFGAVGPTLSGTSQTIRLRFQITARTSSASSQTFHITNSAGTSLGSTTIAVNNFFEIDVAAGTQLQPKFNVSTTSGRRTSAGTVQVTNVTDGGASLGSFTFSITVDNDDNYNKTDNTPDAINVSDLSLNTTEPSGNTTASFFQITGINSAITIRFTRDSLVQSGNIFTRRTMIFHSTTGSGGPWTQYNLGAAAGASIDVTANNGNWFYVQGFVDTTAGRGTASWWNYITNATTGQAMASFYIDAIVDSDDNYNVSPAPSVSLGNPYDYQFVTASPGESVSIGATPNPVVTGGTAPLTYSWTRTGGLALPTTSTTLNPYFSRTANANWNTVGSYQLTVTDAAGRQAFATFNYEWGAGNAV